MKLIFLATTALVAMTGVATAEIALSGSARMGLIEGFGSDDVLMTSRVRVNFALSGETDGGLSFGASVRADQSGQGNTENNDSTVFISGGFGKLSMGDVDGAGAAAVGHVSGVGLTGLGDLNEMQYISNGDTDFFGGAGLSGDPSMLYEYSAGSFTGYVSSTQLVGDVEAYGLGARYSFGDYTLSAAYENADLTLVGVGLDHIALGATATFGPATVKATYGQLSVDGFTDMDQYALSVDYVADALTVTGFYRDSEEIGATPLGGAEAYGLGASYDLGGGAKVVGGYAKDQTADDSAFDMGLSFSF